ncbi:hypothetical protein LAZ67_22001693 [Cordylochernes scorpioides]|uniref:LAGLIDADG homing endonuclease n=1 Tax=Cordylochernes scorpioides TaxID=51811 RepID=A0ABY6LRK4_9ARAC|nr:hypothetical protein LAZ67_22001693 [Cordylochernes scorpioides]
MLFSGIRVELSENEAYDGGCLPQFNRSPLERLGLGWLAWLGTARTVREIEVKSGATDKKTWVITYGEEQQLNKLNKFKRVNRVVQTYLSPPLKCDSTSQIGVFMKGRRNLDMQSLTRCGDFTMERKLKQRICIEFCVKLQISATETFEMLNKAFPKENNCF